MQVVCWIFLVFTVRPGRMWWGGVRQWDCGETGYWDWRRETGREWDLCCIFYWIRGLCMNTLGVRTEDWSPTSPLSRIPWISESLAHNWPSRHSAILNSTSVSDSLKMLTALFLLKTINCLQGSFHKWIIQNFLVWVCITTVLSNGPLWNWIHSLKFYPRPTSLVWIFNTSESASFTIILNH